MKGALWFFLMAGVHSVQIVGPFESEAVCNAVRVGSTIAAKEQLWWGAIFNTYDCYPVRKP